MNDDGEYLSDLSSSCEEDEQLSNKVKLHQNNSNNDNNNDNQNDRNYIYSNDDNNNNNNDAHTNRDDIYHTIYSISAREREQLELNEAIRLSLLESGKNNVIIPKYEDNFNNSSNYQNKFNRNKCAQIKNQSKKSRHHHHRKHNDDDNDGNMDQEVSIEQIILQSKKEEENTKAIREYISSKENLQSTLKELPGVDPDDPCFSQFYD